MLWLSRQQLVLWQHHEHLPQQLSLATSFYFSEPVPLPARLLRERFAHWHQPLSYLYCGQLLSRWQQQCVHQLPRQFHQQ